MLRILKQDKSFIEKLREIKDSKMGEELGSNILMFKRDTLGKIYPQNSAIHSQVETWQWIFGYNDIYDTAFAIGTLGNMRKEKFRFHPRGDKEHIIWTWRGDYINLGTGAEIGMYYNPLSLSINLDFKDKKMKKEMEEWVEFTKELLKISSNSPLPNIEFIHWLSIDYNLPMTLSLYEHEYSYEYKYNNKVEIRNKFKPLFLWRPKEKQWWITGFTGNKHHTTADKLVMVGTINFSGK